MVSVAERRRVPAPGAGAARLYVWLVLGGPVLLLIAGVALTVVGLVYGSSAVAVIGALGVIAALVLPRMKGSFEFGPGGFKGGTWDEFFAEVLRLGTERGLTPADATEVAVAELETARTRPSAAVAASQRVNEAVEHEAELRHVIEAAVEHKGWQARQENQSDSAYGPDFVLETPTGIVLVESFFAKQPGNQLYLKSHHLSEAGKQYGAERAFLVIPNDARIGIGERDGVMVLRPADLWLELQAL
jgi:hypothetical protein